MKNQKSVGMASFYKPPKEVTEVRAGYLLKSPPAKRMSSEKSWKRRYFILFKLSETDYQLKYFRSKEENERTLGEIDLSQVSELYLSPELHPKWNWIQKSFKCSLSCALFIRTVEREYFIIGENSEDMDGWFSNLIDAMKNRPHKLGSPEGFPYKATIEVISKPAMRKNKSSAELDKPPLKIRSQSDPSSNNLEKIIEKPKKQENPKRPESEPVQHIYEVPRPIQKGVNKGGPRRSSVDSLYVTVTDFKVNEESNQPEDKEVAEVNTDSTLPRAVPQTFERLTTRVSPMPLCAEETHADNNGQRWSTDFSSSSSDHGAVSPVEILDATRKRDSSDSIYREPEMTGSPRRRITLTGVNGKASADHTTEERDIVVNQVELKKHLSLTEVDEKPRVSGWTGQPQSMCVFHKGDLILAVNDLHVSSVEEFNVFINKSLKNEVKVTILHECGNEPLHLPNASCTD